jgi:hypothetical protein
MIEILKNIESNFILNLLSNYDNWNTHFEENPHIEKLYTDVTVDNTQYRLFLHYNYPCIDAPLHNHEHNLALRVLDGVYEMGIANFNHFILCKIQCYGGMYYEMTDANAYHYVIPRNGITKAVMVHDIPRDFKNIPLGEDRKNEIFNWFYDFYKKANPLIPI